MTASNLNDCFPKTRLRVKSRSTGSLPILGLVMAISGRGSSDSSFAAQIRLREFFSIEAVVMGTMQQGWRLVGERYGKEKREKKGEDGKGQVLAAPLGNLK
jgi:hypothetical protein